VGWVGGGEGGGGEGEGRKGPRRGGEDGGGEKGGNGRWMLQETARIESNLLKCLEATSDLFYNSLLEAARTC
jgi:hypothetical protein